MKYFFPLFFAFFSLYLSAQVETKELKDDSRWSKVEKNGVLFYTKKQFDRVPILCFHKIGNKERYELTAENFKEFLIYINNNMFYPVSDKQYLDRDFSMVPTGYTPIVLGSDDASEGNFIYKTAVDDNINGEILRVDGVPVLEEESMVYLLENYITPENGIINFTFYVSLDDLPFRQNGGAKATEEYYRGIPVIEEKLNYLLDNFIVGIHTVTHPITRDTAPSEFKWEMEEFFSVMKSYVGNRVSLIDTLAYPYGCADLNPDLRSMLVDYNIDGNTIKGAFDFDGYFAKSPYNPSLDKFEVSRLGVDNKNIEKVYGFLENVPLFKTSRVIVVENRDQLAGINISEEDQIIVGRS